MPRYLRYNYYFPTGYVQKYPLINSNHLVLPIMWGYCASATAPTQTEVDAFTVVDSTSVAASVNYVSAGHTTKYLCIVVPKGLGVPSSVTATTLTMGAQADVGFIHNEGQLMYSVYISTAHVAANGTLTVA